MRMVRQPTIRSMLFLAVLVTVLAAATRTSYEPPLTWVGLWGQWMLPIGLALFIRRLEVITLVAFAMLFLSFTIMSAEGNPKYTPFVQVAFGLFSPFDGIERRVHHQDMNDFSGLFLLLYAVAYFSLGPAFAWTCRMRPPAP